MDSAATQSRKLAIKNVRVFDGHSIGEPTTIFIEDGLISQNVANAAEVDGQGGILLPGYIDAHMHLNTEAELQAMARHGITTALDMATFPATKLQALRELRAKADAAGVALPDFRSPGTPATSPGSMHSMLLPFPPEDFVTVPKDAVRFVQDRLKQDADYIKIVADVPGPDQATINAIVEEAHKHDKLVVAHASGSIPYDMALDSKADIITHVPVDKPLTPETCARMANEGRISVPTLVMMEAVTGSLSIFSLLCMLLRPIALFKIIKVLRQKPAGTGKPNYQNSMESVTNLHRAGVSILCGTDAHEEADLPFSVKHGPSLHRELELLVEAGLSNVEALQAVTSLPAKYFGLRDRGSIGVGKRADLVLLDAGRDPTGDIKATRAVRRVWCAGVEWINDNRKDACAKAEIVVHRQYGEHLRQISHSFVIADLKKMDAAADEFRNQQALRNVLGKMVALLSPRSFTGDSAPITPTALVAEWHALGHEEPGAFPGDDDGPLRWIIDLLAVDPGAPLGDKFLDVLEEANIVLTTSSSLPPPSPFDRPSSPDSIESIDENDTLWQQAIALDNRKLASQALGQWRQRVKDLREEYENWESPAWDAFADGVYNRNLAQKVVSHLRNTLYYNVEMGRVADEFRKKRDAASTLKAWTLATREKIFVRVRDERLARRFMGKWQKKAANLREMEAAADKFRNQTALRNVLGKMAEKNNQIKQAETQAVLLYEGYLVRKVFDKWVAKQQEIQLNERRADAAADFFASKHALQKWREKARIRLEAKEVVKAREHVLGLKYFHKWRVATKKSKEVKYNEAYKIMRRKVKENIARTVLHIWREKARQIRAMNATADEFRARKDEENARRMAHGAIVTMYNKTEQMQEASQQADDFYHKNLVERLGIFGSTWLVSTRQILENQKKADEYRATRTASYALGMLRNWRNMAFRAKRLEEDADALRQRNEKKRFLGFLRKWRQAATRPDENGTAVENSLVPATPAARRSHLLASTTPAYTPAAGLFGAGGRVAEEEDEEEE